MGKKLHLSQVRRRVGVGMVLFIVAALAWALAPGLPILWAPRASAETRAAGKTLFEHEWTVNDPLAGGDGLGPVFNAKSCVACHFQGGVGGGGPSQHNVLAFEALPVPGRPQIIGGLIHHFAVNASLQESPSIARQLFPISPKSVKVFQNCQTTFVDFDPVRTDSINSTALFGAGWVDRVSDRSIQNNRLRKGLDKMVKEFQLDFHSVPPGRTRVLADGRLGKFGWRGQFATLREFVAAACANELGLGNPLMPQAKPLKKRDYPDTRPDLNDKQFRELVAFVDTLPCPVEAVPARPSERDAAVHGKKVFHSVGCVLCHVPDLGGVQGIYSDLLLYDLGGSTEGFGAGYEPLTPPLPLPDGHPKASEWKTPPLWGVADSAPYFHDGATPTLKQAILRHGGDARSVTNAFRALSVADQDALISFLKTLKAPTLVQGK